MAKIQLPITGGFYESESLPISGQRLVNAYVNVPQADTVTDGNLFGTPGLNQLATVSAITTARGQWVMGGIPFFVIGNNLYRLNRTIDGFGVETFTTDDLGIISGSGRVSMADNGTQLCIVVPGGNAYIFTQSPDTLTQITDPDFNGPADSVVFIDGFFVFSKTDSDIFFNSLLNDGLNYNALDFSTADAEPDQIQGLISFNSRLYALGTRTTETFRNIGRDPEPFQRVNGAVFDKGLKAPFSVIKDSTSFVMIGAGIRETPAVWKFTGNGYTKISTTAIDNVLSRLTDTEVSNIFAWTYAEAGAFFIGFQLPNTCLVYDEVTRKWHERLSINDNEDVAYRVAGMAEAYGRILVGDTIDGRIGELDRDVYKEYGGFIKRFFVTKPFDRLGERMSVGEIEAVMESGVGINNEIVQSNGNVLEANRDPELRLSRSLDGGRTFGPELARGLGKTGNFIRRAIWRRMGDFSRSEVLKFEHAEPSKFVFIKLEADVD